MTMPQWLAPKAPQIKGKVRRHYSPITAPEMAYIHEKQKWIDAHPNATTEEVCAAFRKIADRCGI
jgi:hypothetical protein